MDVCIIFFAILLIIGIFAIILAKIGYNVNFHFSKEKVEVSTRKSDSNSNTIEEE